MTLGASTTSPAPTLEQKRGALIGTSFSAPTSLMSSPKGQVFATRAVDNGGNNVNAGAPPGTGYGASTHTSRNGSWQFNPASGATENVQHPFTTALPPLVPLGQQHVGAQHAHGPGAQTTGAAPSQTPHQSPSNSVSSMQTAANSSQFTSTAQQQHATADEEGVRNSGVRRATMSSPNLRYHMPPAAPSPAPTDSAADTNLSSVLDDTDTHIILQVVEDFLQGRSHNSDSSHDACNTQ